MKKVIALFFITLLTLHSYSSCMLVKTKILIKKQTKKYWTESYYNIDALNHMDTAVQQDMLYGIKTRNMDRIKENNATIQQIQTQNTLLLEQYSVISDYLRNNSKNALSLELLESVEYQPKDYQPKTQQNNNLTSPDKKPIDNKLKKINTTIKQLSAKKEDLAIAIKSLYKYVPVYDDEEVSVYGIVENLKYDLKKANLEIEEQYNQLLITESETIRDTLLKKQNSTNNSHE